MPKKKFKCSKCDRSFSMPAHLARHMNATHGSRGKKKTAKKAKRRPKRRMAGRSKGAVGRLGLKNMTLEQLTQLIDAARQEARRRLAEFEASIG